MGVLDNLKKTAQNISEQASTAYDAANLSAQKMGEKIKGFNVEDIISNLKAYEKYFSESELWQKLERFGKSIGATILYPVLLLYNLLKSGEITLVEKATIIGTLGYFILPIDILPDAIAGVGYTDDAAALWAALTALASSLTVEIQQLSKEQLTSLIGEFDDKAIDAISKIIN